MSTEFPMWKDGKKRLLDTVLDRVPEVIHWRLQWFDGVVRPDYGGAPPLDRITDIAFTHFDLRRLAASLADLNSIVLVGECPGGTVRLECEDSDRWVIGGTGSLASVAERFGDL